jgi:N-acetylglucosamine kinase-like BadF-type ATPase
MQPEASKQGRFKKRMMYVEVDVGKSKCRASIMNAEGKIVKELNFTNNSQGISSLTSLLSIDDHVGP